MFAEGQGVIPDVVAGFIGIVNSLSVQSTTVAGQERIEEIIVNVIPIIDTQIRFKAEIFEEIDFSIHITQHTLTFVFAV